MDVVDSRGSLIRYAWLPVGAAVTTIALKTTGYLVTNSVSLLSDALESGVNLLAALVVLAAIRVATRPPDEQHAYGHEKAEYFSSGIEGLLIILASLGIAAASLQRLSVGGVLIVRLDVGLALLLAAVLVNFGTAQFLRRSARRQHSIALRADSQHLMADVWTSAAVVVGIGIVGATGWNPLDPLLALGISAHIARSGVRLLRESALGLMDTSLPGPDLEAIEDVLDRYSEQGVRYHALRTRRAGARVFVSVHILVPGHWTVQKAHDLLEVIEHQIRRESRATTVFTHLEPVEDPRSMLDKELDRPQG